MASIEHNFLAEFFFLLNRNSIDSKQNVQSASRTNQQSFFESVEN